MDPRKGFKIRSDGTTAGTKLYDENGNPVSGVVYLELQVWADEDTPRLRVDFLHAEEAEEVEGIDLDDDEDEEE